MSPIKPTPTRRKYDEDFKAEVLKMLESGQSVSAVSQALGIGENLVYRWKSKQKASLMQQAKQEPSEFSLKVLQENEALKERVKQLELEGEILKKALRIFSRST
jgi:transposase